MTQEQATEINDHLISEMERNGLGDIRQQVYLRQQELLDDRESSQEISGPIRTLYFYLNSTIDILDQISGHHYPKVLARLNENLGDEKISEIVVELNNESVYELKDLPSYLELIQELRAIRSELRESENN